MNRKGIFKILAIVVLSFMFVNLVGQSKTKAYYSGHALAYNNNIFITSTNTGYLEVFKYEPGKTDLKNIIKLKPVQESGMISTDFNSAVLSEEGGQLYVYASSGNRLYKYLINNDEAFLANKTIDNTWDWYGRLDKVGGKVVSLGTKTVKIWNSDLQAIDSYKISNASNPHNLRLSTDGKFIFNIKGSELSIFDRTSRRIVKTINLYSSNVSGNRRLAYDEAANMIYVIDDGALNQFSTDGDIYKSLRHDSGFGYDSVLSADNQFIYVSNGSSIAKLKKSNFKFVTALENIDLGIANSWAMGINRVDTSLGEYLVVFNNSNILLLNPNMKFTASYKSIEQDNQPSIIKPKENLSISLDKMNGAAYSNVMVSGGGYWPNEELEIWIGDKNYQSFTDEYGRYVKTVTVPATKADRIDIKALGKNSKLSYSISFKVDQVK